MRNMRLSTRLPLLIVVLALVVVVAVMSFEFATVRNSITSTAEDANVHSVKSYASAIDTYVGEARSIIEITAHQVGAMGATETSSQAIVTSEEHKPLHELATSIMESSSAFEYIILLNADGSINATAPHELRDNLVRQDLGFTDWYKKLTSTGETVISDLHISSVTRRPTVVVATPVRDSSGQITGAWLGGLELQQLSRIGVAPGVVRSYGFVTDGRGLILAHQTNSKYVEDQTDFSSTPPVKAALAGEQGTMQFVSTIDGVEKLAAYMPLPDLGWVVVFQVPTDVAFASLNDLLRTTVGLTILMIVLLGIGGVLVARQITTPLGQLTAAAERLGGGDLSQRIQVRSGDEIGMLGAAFNHMAASLEEQIQQREVAERQRTRAEASAASARLAQDMINSMMDAVILTDLDGKITQFNEATTSMFGYGEELIGQLPTALVVERDAPTVHAVIQETMEKGFASNREHTGITKQRKEFPVLVSASIVMDDDGRPAGIIGVVKDITDLRRAEKHLQQRTLDLERSNAELERFAYVASHDLQEPLRMVASYTQLLERRYKDKLDADAHDFINFAVDGAKRMQHLIDDLLTYSRVGTRGRPFERTDCRAVVQAAIANLDVAIRETGATVTVDALPIVMADEGQLVQVFQNLIGNAIKFHDDSRTPQIKVSSRLNDDHWEFSVKDNGIGIDPQYFDRVFVVFQRLQGSNYSGTGIGLAVCKKIVERHGGRIRIESQPGEGSTFHFTLPKRNIIEEDKTHDDGTNEQAD